MTSGGAPLDIEYENTFEDLYAFHWRSVFVSRVGRRARLYGYLGWLLAVLLLAIVPAIDTDGITLSRISLGFMAIALPAGFLFQWTVERWVMRRVLRHMLKAERPGKGVLGRHRIVLSDYGVTETSSVNETRTAWAGVDRVEQSPDYIFLYITPSSAHVIPKRAFPGGEAAEAFYQFARGRRETAG